LEEIGAAAFGSEFFAAGFDAEGLLHGSEAQAAGDAVVEDFEMIIFELDDLAAIDADEVVVGRAVEKIGVVGGLAVTEVDFLDESRFDEEAEGAVDGGAGGLQLATTDAVPELVGGEMLVRGENEGEDGVPLWGLSEAFLADEVIKTLADLLVHVGSLQLRMEKD
jgi:hypothetical protein